MAIQGKGFFTWKIPNCEGGVAAAIAAQAKSADLTHVLVKIADGTYSYNLEKDSRKDLLPAVVQALHEQGIQAWGWHYVYGNNPLGEANKAIQRIQELGVDGYVIDAEEEYKLPGRKEAARRFMNQLRTAMPSLPIGLSSYRYPSYHPQLPWKEFLEQCDFNMPQVYWMKAHNPAEQLKRCVREFQAMAPSRPIVATGAAFRQFGWAPTAAEILEFLQAVRSLNLSGANFWEWSEARTARVPGGWDTIRDFNWSEGSLPADVCEKYIKALNNRDPLQVANLYTPTAVHITSARTIQGAQAIHTWYQGLFYTTLPEARFTLTGFSGSGNSRHLTWTATSRLGSVQNGSDTLGVTGDKIAYHYTSFTVS